jgi:dephospho-CoA kinase
MFEKNSEMDRLIDSVQFDLMRTYEKWRIKHKGKPYTIFKSCVLFERGLNTSMNFNINTYRPKQDRKADIQTLTSMTESKIMEILNNEMSDVKKNEKSDYVVHNYIRWSHGGVNFLNQVDKIHESIVSKSNMTCDDLIGFA